VEVNVPPPTVIFSDTNENNPSNPSSPFELQPADARLAITRIVPMPPTPPINTPSFHVSYHNEGKLPWVGTAMRYSVLVSAVPLSTEDTNRKQLQTSTFLKSELNVLDVDNREVYPNQAVSPFVSIPSNTNAPFATQIKSAVDAINGGDQTTYLYMFLTLVYRDRIMPKSVYGITEECIYFSGTMTWHACGSMHSRRRATDLLAGRVSSGAL
jgi:hypothetical protein